MSSEDVKLTGRRCWRRSRRYTTLLQEWHLKRLDLPSDKTVSLCYTGDLDSTECVVGKISLPSTTLHFFDLGGQRDIRSIWPKYYDECHAVVFVLDACDQARLSEGWEVFGMSLCPSCNYTDKSDEVLNSPRLLNLPLLLLANKQDSPTSLSVSEIRESFDAWTRAHPERRRAALEARNDEAGETEEEVERKGKGKEIPRADGW
jgi:signal recognition particle receptor subunit beta